jgi:hypothetical protein
VVKAGVTQVIKIWLLVMFISMPNQPSVKYNALIYPTEEKCISARNGYKDAYDQKPQSYKDTIKTDATCIAFDSFPIPGFNAISA